MSIVAVHGPNTFGSKGVTQVSNAKASVNGSNGLVWTFQYAQPTTRTASMVWTYPTGTPATSTGPGPTTVTFASAGAKAVTVVSTGTGEGANPQPAAGTINLPVTAVSGTAPQLLMAEGGGDESEVQSFSAEEEEQPTVEVGYDPAAHTVTEVIGFVEDNPEQLEAILLAEEEGKARTTLISHLESMRSS